MLVFIDESGDPGFNLKKGSSPVFVAAMVIFETAEDALAVSRSVRALQRELSINPEFKFNRCSDEVRAKFFRHVRDLPFVVRAIVVDKQAVYSSHLRSDREDFYRFFIRQMLSHDDGFLRNAKVVIDGSGDREFRRMLGATLRRQVGERIREVSFARSQSDPLVQLADMCAGAIARSFRRDRPKPMRFRSLLGKRIVNVWVFK